ncbi:MAG: hypothetical protein M3Y60_04410 [Bacteroidota bacterium]|nr:hypothetical protein [Bacteroidota bacterium]
MVIKAIVVLFLAALPLTGFSQLLEFDSVRKLPRALNSAGEESLPLLAPDGRSLFFTRALYAGNAGGKFSGLDVWHSEGAGANWTNASNSLPAGINNEGHNAIIGMSRDGSKRYFISSLPGEKMHGIYVTTRINNYWSRAELVPIPGIDNQDFVGVFVSPDFDVILFSMQAPDSRGQEDLYFSVRNSAGQWSSPQNMGATINTKGFEISPFLSADKKRLYFTSNGHGGEGDADIFYSDRLYNSWETWSLPVNLGNKVNSKKFDAYFSIYGDSIAFFASNRDGKYADLYEVTVTRARTVLASGQRYLSTEEWSRYLGGSVSDLLSFNGEATALNAAQKELLFYVANKLQLEKSVLFHLVVEEEDTSARSKTRLDSIREHLIQSGIAEQRIIIEQVEPIRKGRGGKIRIRLIE